MTKIINFFGGPGSGKSTYAAGLFYTLKLEGFNVELITEYAKDLTWEQSLKKLDNQIYIFAKQYHRQWIVADKVDIVITDSPILLSGLVYGKTSEKFHDFALECFNQFDNINFYLNRQYTYSTVGRNQTKREAEEIDEKIWFMLKDNKIDFETIESGHDNLSDIYGHLTGRLQ